MMPSVPSSLSLRVLTSYAARGKTTSSVRRRGVLADRLERVRQRDDAAEVLAAPVGRVDRMNEGTDANARWLGCLDDARGRNFVAFLQRRLIRLLVDLLQGVRKHLYQTLSSGAQLIRSDWMALLVVHRQRDAELSE